MDTQILLHIWARSMQSGGAPYLATISRPTDQFQEIQAGLGDLAMLHLEHKRPGQDLFFSPLLFEGARKNENATAPGVLYADMDNVREHKDQLHHFWPHVLWMTSNENAQAVWFLRSPMTDLDAWSQLNQRMTYFMGADKGGWHASKLLRVPGTHNWKYDPPQIGTVVSFQPEATLYDAEALLAELPPVRNGGGGSDTHPTPIPREEWKRHVAKIWFQLPLRTRSDLLTATMPDRSEALVRASNKMRFAGISPEDQFQALYWVEWNKFRDRPQLLWDIVSYQG